MYPWSQYNYGTSLGASLAFRDPDCTLGNELNESALETEPDESLWGVDKRLWRLPFELQTQIINLLNVETKLTCLRVSKSWHAHLLDPAFWSSLVDTESFRSAKRPTSKFNYMKAIDNAQGGLRNLDVAFPDRLTTRVLKHIEATSAGNGSQLRSLSLVNCSKHARFDRVLNHQNLDFCASTLQHLRLENWQSLHLPSKLPALKALNITTCEIYGGADCPRLVTLSIFASWGMIELNSAQFLMPNARAARLSFKYLAGPIYAYNRPILSDLEQILMMKCYNLEELDIEVLDRAVSPLWSVLDYKRNSMQLETIVRVLEEYGRNLKSLTLRNPCQTDETLAAAFRLCPRLAGIHVYQTRQGLHPHFDDNDRFGAHQWTVLDSNDCLYSYHLRPETL